MNECVHANLFLCVLLGKWEVMGEGRASANSTPQPCLLNEAARRDGGNQSLMGKGKKKEEERNWSALVLRALLIRF